MATTQRQPLMPVTPAVASTQNSNATPQCDQQQEGVTVDTPTIIEAFQRVLSATPAKRSVKCFNGAGKSGACHNKASGTPPQHDGVPTAQSAARGVKNRAPSSTNKTKRKRRALFSRNIITSPRVARGTPRTEQQPVAQLDSSTPSDDQPSPQLAEAARAVVRNAADVDASTSSFEEDSDDGVVDEPLGNDATPESCASTPTKDAMAQSDAAPPSASQRDAGQLSGEEEGEAKGSVEGGDAASADGATPELNGIPGRFLTPSFLQGGSDRKVAAQRPHADSVAGWSGNNNTPRSFMRMLSRKSRNVNASVEANNVADHDSTPRSMVKRFIASGMRSGDLTADTPATRKRRALARRRLEDATSVDAVAASEGGVETTVWQRLLHVVLFIVLFCITVLVLCKAFRPVRRIVQRIVFGDMSDIRYT